MTTKREKAREAQAKAALTFLEECTPKDFPSAKEREAFAEFQRLTDAGAPLRERLCAAAQVYIASELHAAGQHVRELAAEVEDE